MYGLHIHDDRGAEVPPMAGFTKTLYDPETNVRMDVTVMPNLDVKIDGQPVGHIQDFLENALAHLTLEVYKTLNESVPALVGGKNELVPHGRGVLSYAVGNYTPSNETTEAQRLRALIEAQIDRTHRIVLILETITLAVVVACTYYNFSYNSNFNTALIAWNAAQAATSLACDERVRRLNNAGAGAGVFVWGKKDSKSACTIASEAEHAMYIEAAAIARFATTTVIAAGSAVVVGTSYRIAYLITKLKLTREMKEFTIQYKQASGGRPPTPKQILDRLEKRNNEYLAQGLFLK